MNYLVYFLLLSLSCRGADGALTEFFKGSYQELLSEAKKQKKAIFVDVSTVWCGPCKRMNKEAFTSDQVASQLNSSFLSYKIDAEKGEGILLAKKFNVVSYPTLLFLTNEGTLMYRSIGYTDIPDFLAQLTIATTAINYSEPISSWKDEYLKGNLSQKFLYTYLNKREKLGLLGGTIIDDYLKTQKPDSLLTERNVVLLSKTVSTSDSYAYDVLFQYVVSQTNLIKDKDLYERCLLQLKNALLYGRREAIASRNDKMFNDYLKKESIYST